MKELRVPIPQDNVVEISEIVSDYSGLIICYTKEQAIGYIHYYDCEWCFSRDIDATTVYYQDESLHVLIKDLVSQEGCDKFKVLSFK